MDKEIGTIFENLIKESNDDGVIEIDSGYAGEETSIVGLNHGDEIVGLYVFDYLINKFNIKDKIKRGKLNLIFGNLKASYERLVNGEPMVRCIDENFNRVWDYNDNTINSYERQRKLEIEKYIERTNALLDIHSTTKPSHPMILPVKYDKEHISISKRFYGDYLISNIFNFIDGGALAEYHNNLQDNNFSLVIESGQHSDKEKFNHAIDNSLIFLASTGIIKNSDLKLTINESTTKQLKIYYCYYSQKKGEKIDYIYSKNPNSFDYINKGEKIADTESGEIFANRDSYIIMPTIEAPLKGEEMFYLAFVE